ncbi:type II secretion system protein GspD, partial [Candidatus Similichlamydia epinepheli]|uniref:type II secretion system protein GspD n=1 Tax=Candidatus Similichlamydia epinepheli TaxID=1903953 RepID=UPI003B96809A
VNSHGAAESDSAVSSDWAGLGSGFSSGVIGRFITYQGRIFSTLGSLVQALNADGNMQVVMNPKILSEENKSASFFVGETTRIKVSTQKSGDSAGLVVSGYELRDIGSSIQVNPRINNDQTISLKITQEISESNQLADGDTSAILPLTKTSRTNTEVLVPNKGFVVLSGMTHEKVRKSWATIPFLGSIPFISALFSKSVHTTDKRNLLIFIRAQIVYDENDSQNILQASKKIVDQISSHFESFEEKFSLFSPPVL